jgi:hypothetical protein
MRLWYRILRLVIISNFYRPTSRQEVAAQQETVVHTDADVEDCKFAGTATSDGFISCKRNQSCDFGSEAYNYAYYEDLLNWATTTDGQATTTKHSDVVTIQENGQIIRIGRIVSMFDVIGDKNWLHLDEMDQLVVARAVIDFNNRTSLTTQSVAKLTQGCNFYLSLKIRELDEFGENCLSPIQAWQEEVNATVRPMGFVGAYKDINTGFIAALSSGQEDPLPLVSPYSAIDESQNDRESKYKYTEKHTRIMYLSTCSADGVGTLFLTSTFLILPKATLIWHDLRFHLGTKRKPFACT